MDSLIRMFFFFSSSTKIIYNFMGKLRAKGSFSANSWQFCFVFCPVKFLKNLSNLWWFVEVLKALREVSTIAKPGRMDWRYFLRLYSFFSGDTLQMKDHCPYNILLSVWLQTSQNFRSLDVRFSFWSFLLIQPFNNSL